MSTENVTAIAKVLWGGAGLIALVALVQLVLQPVFVEIYRQKMFNLRRQMFLYMLDGHVRPEEPCYRLLLEAMNAMIRYAQIVSISRFLLSWPVTRGQVPEWKILIDSCIEAIEDPAVKAQMMKFRDQISKETGLHLFRTSPTLWLITIAAVIPALLVSCFVAWRTQRSGKVVERHQRAAVKKFARQVVGEMESEAVALYDLDFARHAPAAA